MSSLLNKLNFCIIFRISKKSVVIILLDSIDFRYVDCDLLETLNLLPVYFDTSQISKFPENLQNSYQILIGICYIKFIFNFYFMLTDIILTIISTLNERLFEEKQVLSVIEGLLKLFLQGVSKLELKILSRAPIRKFLKFK